MDSLREVLVAGQASPAFFPFPLHVAVPCLPALLSLTAAGPNRAVKHPLVPQLPCAELAQVSLTVLNYVFEMEPVDSKGRA